MTYCDDIIFWREHFSRPALGQFSYDYKKFEERMTDDGSIDVVRVPTYWELAAEFFMARPSRNAKITGLNFGGL